MELNKYPEGSEFELLGRFPNGIKLYENSQMFRTILYNMRYGMTPYEAIEFLIDMNTEFQKSFTEYVRLDARPMTWVGQKDELIK